MFPSLYILNFIDEQIDFTFRFDPFLIQFEESFQILNRS